ncbi:MAG: hypothetical protein HY725_13870 [Candidatus Rokubacteria bacterium]|nr:hypothetical protein [Candidatus Rokubacteria bacterium]
MTSKFVSFFRLIEACAHEGCPVCRCLREDAVQYLDALLYERVNDPGTRAALRASGGFCNWHAWLTRDILHSGLGTGIISEDLLGGALGRLRRQLVRVQRGPLSVGWLHRLFGRFPRLSFLTHWRRKAICPACRSAREAEASYLLAVLEFTGDPQFDRAFERSPGLCLPHVLRLVALGPSHARLETVLERVATKWQRLQAELKGFVAKHDYRTTEPFTDDEAKSWTLAIELLAGAPGIFGNELHGDGSPAAEPLIGPQVLLDRSPVSQSDPETLRFEKEKLELRVKELTDQFSEVSSRAAALHYRLWEVLEDRKALEMNLSGEQASSRLWERKVEELQKQIDRLREQASRGRGPE